MAALATGGKTIAILPWGEVIEEFLHPIGLDLHDFVERMSGGWLFGYVQALQGQGWRPIILCASERVDRRTRLQHAGTGAPVWIVPGRRVGGGPDPRYPSLRYLERCLRSPSRQFGSVLADEACAAILVQEYEYFRFDWLGMLARRIGLPIYATFQGGDITLSAIEGWIRPFSLRRCNGLIVASARERARLTASYPDLRTPVAAIPNPLDIDEWRPQDRASARQQLGLPADALIAINHGRIDIVRKGLDILIEAWAQFSPGYPRAQAFVVGSGQDHHAFSQLLMLRATKRLTWIDQYITDRPSIRLWLSAADVYLITSRSEGMPVAPLEAMACGLPVISTDAHGLPDIFAAGEEHGGIIAAREDVSAIAAALRRLAADRDLRLRLGHAARRRVERHFSLPAVGRALSDFLNDPAATDR